MVNSYNKLADDNKKKSNVIACIILFVCFGISSNAFSDLNEGLIAHYSFDGNAHDDSGNGNNGIEFGLFYQLVDKFSSAIFDRFDESRLEIPFSIMPTTGSLIMNVKIDRGYDYTNYSLSDNNIHALVFTTDVQHGDVTYAGSSWFYVYDDGRMSWRIATSKYGSTPAQSIFVDSNIFTFNAWHQIGVSFGDSGQKIYLDGKIVASENSNTQLLGSGGNHSSAIDIPTIGESVPGYWSNNQYEGGFYGAVDDVRIYNRALSESEVQKLYQQTIGTDNLSFLPAIYSFLLQPNQNILKDEVLEDNNPYLVSGTHNTTLSKGNNYFKFLVEPNYDYSFIVNTHNYSHDLFSSGGDIFSIDNPYIYDQNISGLVHPNSTNNPDGKSSVIVFNPSSNLYYHYINIVIEGDIQPNDISNIRLVKTSNKKFGYPFKVPHVYYNPYKGKVNNMNNPHDGIDIAPWSNRTTTPVYPMADGCIAKIAGLSNASGVVQTILGKGVWIHHTLPDNKKYTSLYAHLDVNENLIVGQCVKRGEEQLGTLIDEEQHLHLEMIDGHTEVWSAGYSNANVGQIDPVSIVFEK